MLVFDISGVSRMKSRRGERYVAERAIFHHTVPENLSVNTCQLLILG